MNASAAGATALQDKLSIEPFAGTVTVRFSDAIIASTERAKIVRESGHDPVYYVPFDDIYFELLEKTDKTTRCPLEGTASYWRVHAVGASAEDFMWSYETPIASALELAAHGAFDPDSARIDVDPAEDHRHTPHIEE